MDREVREHIAKGLADGSFKLFQSEDKFNFKCTACGQCCFGLDVLLNPMDVYMMSRSKMARNTYKVRWTHDLLEKGLVRLSRGPDSGYPVATIGFKETGPGKTTYCPFLTPKNPDRHGMDLLKGLSRADVWRYSQNGINFTCGLHEEGLKPVICRLSPLGRAYEKPEEGKERTVKYFWQPIQGCPGVKSENEWVLKDYLEKAQIDRITPYSAWFYNFIEEHHVEAKAMDEESSMKLGFVLYNLDCVFLGMKSEEEIEEALAKGDVPSQKFDEGDYFETVKGLAEAFFKMYAKEQEKSKP